MDSPDDLLVRQNTGSQQFELPEKPTIQLSSSISVRIRHLRRCLEDVSSGYFWEGELKISGSDEKVISAARSSSCVLSGHNAVPYAAIWRSRRESVPLASSDVDGAVVSCHRPARCRACK